MKKNILLSCLGLCALLFSGNVYAQNADDTAAKGKVLFKIHDISPAKDNNGNVTHCNMSATFYNNYDKALSNIQVTLAWNDDVINNIINQEEYDFQERVRANPDTQRSRYTTAQTTSPIVSTIVKIPLVNAHQQVSLRNKVNTDRCFLLLNDMNIQVNGCSFAGEKTSNTGCPASFTYVSPNEPQYYSEFKEISYEEEVMAENQEIDEIQNENNDLYNEIITTLRKIEP